MPLILNLLYDDGTLRRNALDGHLWLRDELLLRCQGLCIRTTNIDENKAVAELYRPPRHQLPALVYSTQHRLAEFCTVGDADALARAVAWVDTLRTITNPDIAQSFRDFDIQARILLGQVDRLLQLPDSDLSDAQRDYLNMLRQLRQTMLAVLCV